MNIRPAINSITVIPTPIIAFAAKYYNSCAFMFTASHNPPNYLGVKFIPDYGGPATTEITDEISSSPSFLIGVSNKSSLT